MVIFLAVLDYLSITDPAQAALTWQTIESVVNGLGNANGEILAALRAGGLSKRLNILGLFVGAVSILSIIPGLTDLTGAFGLSQMIWFVWLGIVLLRGNPGLAEQPSLTSSQQHPEQSLSVFPTVPDLHILPV